MRDDLSRRNACAPANVLWISGRLPHPLMSGDALYSSGLISALAASGTQVSVVGAWRAKRDLQRSLPVDAGVNWFGVEPSNKTAPLSILSRLPKDAYLLASQELKAAVRQLSGGARDWIVIDHANSGGLLREAKFSNPLARVCYIAHNAEGVIRPAIARKADLTRRSLMRWDAEKYRRLELTVLEGSDAVICITEEDAHYFRRFNGDVNVIPPVFLGKSAGKRMIDASTPRRIVLVGSFEWGAKQKNLDQIVNVMQPILASARIELNVIGRVPKPILDKFANNRPFLRFHGPVEDIAKFMSSSRGGLVAELFGGGFKLKVLDYAFAGVPIFGLSHALAGIKDEERDFIFEADTLDALAEMVVNNVDRIVELNRRQKGLLNLIEMRFCLDNATMLIKEVFGT
jgi:hypothetical protein